MSTRTTLLLLGCLAMAPLAMAADEDHGPPPGTPEQGLGPPPGALERWAAHDTDGDGAISLAEAQAGAPGLAQNFTKFDVIPTDKEMAQPKMWWMSILGDYRDYRYVWNQDSGFVPVEHVAAIAMQYKFVDEGPYVLVRYFFDNIDECRKALNADEVRPH